MNENIIYEGELVAITLGKKDEYAITNCGNFRSIPNEQLGTAYYHAHLNDRNKNEILDYLNSNNIIPATTLVIDSSVLKDDDIVAAIRRKVELNRSDNIGQRSHDLLCIRILDKDYTLTPDDYEKIKYFDYIIINNCDESLSNYNNIHIQESAYILDHQEKFQPVIERRKDFNETMERNVYHIDHKLTNEEFEQLVQDVNDDSISSIELNVYDQTYYKEFLDNLQRYNVKENVNIALIGYPLEDNSNIYSKLNDYPYEIDIVYSLCHDMVERYEKEPYTENRLLYSYLEGGGKTSLENYINILKLLEEFKDDVNRMNLSPLEATIYAKQKIDEEYIYDPDFEEANTDQWDNINLSQLIKYKDGKQKKAICVGFSTLTSALLRYCDIPMFRTSTRQHTKNIGRIKDDKYGIDTIATFDMTSDLYSSNEKNVTYSSFGLAPRTNLNIPDAIIGLDAVLSLPLEEYVINALDAEDIYELFYSPSTNGISPLGYTTRMLELAGYIPENLKEIDLYDYIYRLCEDKHLEEVDRNAIKEAARSVLEKTNKSQDEITQYINDIDNSFIERDLTYSYMPQLSTTTTRNPLPIAVNTITPENVNYFRDFLINNNINPIIFYGRGSHDSENESENLTDENTVYDDELPNNTSIQEESTSQEISEEEIHIEDTTEDNTISGSSSDELSQDSQTENYDEINNENSKEEVVKEEIIDNNENQTTEIITFYIDDSGKIYVKKYVKQRFNLEKSDEVRINGFICEEINEAEREWIEENQNNSYSPYRIIIERVNSVDNIKNEDNNQYIRDLLTYTRENNISVFNYYKQLANTYRNNQIGPEFEENNRFLNEKDYKLLIDSNDQDIANYFANSMNMVIQLNLQNILNNTENIAPPREREIEESLEEYVEYLSNYYFENMNNNTIRR